MTMGLVEDFEELADELVTFLRFGIKPDAELALALLDTWNRMNSFERAHVRAYVAKPRALIEKLPELESAFA